MKAYVVVLALAAATGCASEIVAVPVPTTACAARPCSEPPEELVESAKALGFNMHWEITRECAEHDIGLLGGLFRVSARTNVSMAVWGRDRELTRTTIVRALNQPGDRATKLRLAFYGDPADVEIVRHAVIARGGTYIEAPMLPNNAFERTVEQSGPRLAAASTSCSAAQLGR